MTLALLGVMFSVDLSPMETQLVRGAAALRDFRTGRATLSAVERRQLFAARVTRREGEAILYLYSPFWLYTAPTADPRSRLPR